MFVLGEGQGKSKSLGKLFETVAKDLQASIYFGKVSVVGEGWCACVLCVSIERGFIG